MLDYAPGRTDSSVVEVPLSAGALRVHNVSHGSVQLTADVVGFVAGRTLTPPPTSISRYLGDLTRHDSDLTIMDQHGCADATAMRRVGPRFVLLDVGAQSVTGRLAGQGGVSLTQTERTIRLTYPRTGQPGCRATWTPSPGAGTAGR